MSNALSTHYTIWDRAVVAVGEAHGLLPVHIGENDPRDGITIMAIHSRDCRTIAAAFIEAAEKLEAAEAAKVA